MNSAFLIFILIVVPNGQSASPEISEVATANAASVALLNYSITAITEL